MNRVLLAVAVVVGIVLLRAWSNPCGTPITYRIGEVDSRFGLSESQMRTAIRRAEAVWEDSTGRELFRYQDDGSLVVNFVYDARQQTAQQNASRRNNIERASGSAEEARAAYDEARQKYEAARKQFEAAHDAHERRVASHNREVEQSNARGGATPAQGSSFRARAAGLDEAAAVLERRRVEVNAMADRANSLSKRFNELADEVNSNVEAVNATAGREFKQGRYVRNPQGTRIDVFEFVGPDDLVHLLAHELGHALGIEHDDNDESIMYGRNSTKAVVLTPADREALRTTCRL